MRSDTKSGYEFFASKRDEYARMSSRGWLRRYLVRVARRVYSPRSKLPPLPHTSHFAVTTKTTVTVDFGDRLRVLFGGRVCVEVRLETGKPVLGPHLTVSRASICPPEWAE